MFWCEDIQKASEDLDGSLRIVRLLRLTFGDQSAAVFLELALRIIVAPHCKTKLGPRCKRRTGT